MKNELFTECSPASCRGQSLRPVSVRKYVFLKPISTEAKIDWVCSRHPFLQPLGLGGVAQVLHIEHVGQQGFFVGDLTVGDRAARTFMAS